jgi:hypothetical protein
MNHYVLKMNPRISGSATPLRAMSKRRRLLKTPPPRTYDADLSQSLACVRVLCRHGPNVLRLPHILDKLNEFLD